jgi:hypothetical protein
VAEAGAPRLELSVAAALELETPDVAGVPRLELSVATVGALPLPPLAPEVTDASLLLLLTLPPLTFDGVLPTGLDDIVEPRSFLP